jgi:GntR family transcriptional regulator
MILIRIDPASDRPLYLQVVDQVRQELVRGNISAGEPLPSVRQLAEELRLNPNTIQQAYRELEREGVAVVRRGQGTFVREDVQPDFQRAALVERVARDAMLQAARAGVSGAELVQALRSVLSQQSATENGK